MVAQVCLSEGKRTSQKLYGFSDLALEVIVLLALHSSGYSVRSNGEELYAISQWGSGEVILKTPYGMEMLL